MAPTSGKTRLIPKLVSKECESGYGEQGRESLRLDMPNKEDRSRKRVQGRRHGQEGARNRIRSETRVARTSVLGNRWDITRGEDEVCTGTTLEV